MKPAILQILQSFKVPFLGWVGRWKTGRESTCLEGLKDYTQHTLTYRIPRVSRGFLGPESFKSCLEGFLKDLKDSPYKWHTGRLKDSASLKDS